MPPFNGLSLLPNLLAVLITLLTIIMQCLVLESLWGLLSWVTTLDPGLQMPGRRMVV